MDSKANLVDILNSNIGFEIGLFGMLYIDQLEDGRFRVLCQLEPTGELSDGQEYLFEDVNEAVDQFLRIRSEQKLGFDYEIEEFDKERKKCQ